MSLAGTGTRFVSSVTHGMGSPGGSIDITLAVQPTGNYPALGEPVATLLAASAIGTKAKFVAGVAPDAVFCGTSNLGHVWSYDPAQGTMGTLRNWTTVGATPSEHATGAYGGNEASAVFRVTFRFPMYASMER